MDKAVLVLAELLFNEDMLAQISKHSVLFKKVIIVDALTKIISI